MAGYIFNVPFFYYEVSGQSTAMAIHTALAFIIIGSGVTLSGKVNVY